MIRYCHIRHKNKAGVVQAKGGATIAYDTETHMGGVAVCCEKDNYKKSRGRQIALARATKAPKRYRVLKLENANFIFPYIHQRSIVLVQLYIECKFNILNPAPKLLYPATDPVPILVKKGGDAP